MAKPVHEYIFVWDEYIIAHIYAHSAQIAWNHFFEVWGKEYGNKKVSCFRYDSRLSYV